MCAWNTYICTAYYAGLIPRVTGSLQLLLPCFVVHTPSWLLLYRKINLVQGFHSYVCLERSERNETLYEHGIFSDETIKDIRYDYNYSKEHNNDKDKDDYDIEI